jgi:hypothetical protein
VKSGRFEIHGLDPDGAVPFYFLDPHHKLGATVDFTGKSAAGGPVTVRLEPCGTAKARLVDVGGKPVAGFRVGREISMTVTPANIFRYFEAALFIIDPVNYPDGPVSDAMGRIALPALIPGAPYHLSTNGRTVSQHDKDFTVKPGEALDLGDVVVEKPRGPTSP